MSQVHLVQLVHVRLVEQVVQHVRQLMHVRYVMLVLKSMPVFVLLTLPGPVPLQDNTRTLMVHVRI